MIDTTIYIGAVAIHEPVTAFTDYIIASMAFYFYLQLNRNKNGNSIIINWSGFFGLLSLSTLLGGSAHAFFGIHEGVSYKMFWLGMQIANGVAVYFAQQATLASVLANSKNKSKWKWSYIIQLILFIIAALFFQNYLVTIVDNAVALIPIMIIHFIASPKEDYQKKIGYGISISFITAIVHGAKISLCAYFNYNDIAHVFIMISLFVMYKAVKQKAIS
jgi:hypothetical protein